MAIEDVLQEIRDVLNNDLVRHTFELNGWDTKEMPKITFGDLDDFSLDEFSKGVQRMFSVSAVEMDRPMANKIRKALGVPPKADDAPIDWDEIPAFSSRAGDGMSKGSGNGTSDDVAGQDNSTSNQEN